MKKIQNYFYEFLTNHINDRIPAYKQTGINYIKFAKEEKNIFKVLFMSKTNLSINEFIDVADGNFNEVEKYIRGSLFVKKEIKHLLKLISEFNNIRILLIPITNKTRTTKQKRYRNSNS